MVLPAEVKGNPKFTVIRYICAFFGAVSTIFAASSGMHAAYCLATCCYVFIKSWPNLHTVSRNVLNNTKQEEKRKYRQRAETLQINTPLNTSSGLSVMIERDYFCMSLNIAF